MPPAATALAAALAAAIVLAPALADDGIVKSHGLAIFGDLKYGPDFAHFDYVNPDAPKGGTVRYSAIGTFDTLNPLTLKGVAATASALPLDTLMARAEDEPASEYGLIAESAEVPADRSWVQFNLRPEARFHDGAPVTPEDVIWTFDTLKTQGHPFFRLYYADVVKAEKVGEHSVKFLFRSGANRELPSIVGEMAVLPKKYWDGRDFTKTTLEPPLSSGPYKIETFEPGRSITYRRVADYWGKDLPVNRGRHNFDTIRYDYYRDGSVALEAFKAGEYDIRVENSAKNWATGYDSPALRDGLFTKENIPNEVPTGMQAFGFNTRFKYFQDRKVREALDQLFDFDWANKNLFYGQYSRTESYFSNSELASSGLPSADELKILEKYRGQIPEEVFTSVFQEPKTDGSGNIRENIRKALQLMKEAGWTVKGEKLVNEKTGEPFTFEFLLDQPEFERIVLPFIRNLARIGIDAHLRTIDPAQYENRMKSFDFEMTVASFPQSLSPGNEQRDFWSSAAAEEQGSRNVLGIKSGVVDDLVGLVITAPDRAGLLTRVHALDRVLLNEHYVIPNWHLTSFRVASWNKFARPKKNPPYALALDTWWIDLERERSVETGKAQESKK
jgi:microcin C transport system substrate-binding protein